MMRVLFLTTERLESSGTGRWAVLVIFLACFIMRGEFYFGRGGEEVEPGWNIIGEGGFNE